MWNADTLATTQSDFTGPGAAEIIMLMSSGGLEAGHPPLCLRAYLGIPISHELIQI